MAANSPYFKVDAPISVSSVESDVISEKTAAAGVTVDGCLIKDGRAAGLATGSLFLSGNITGTGSAVNTAHGFAAVPTITVAIPVRGHNGAGAAGTNMPEITAGTHTSTNAIFTAEAGAQYRVLCIK